MRPRGPPAPDRCPPRRPRGAGVRCSAAARGGGTESRPRALAAALASQCPSSSQSRWPARRCRRKSWPAAPSGRPPSLRSWRTARSCCPVASARAAPPSAPSSSSSTDSQPGWLASAASASVVVRLSRSCPRRPSGARRVGRCRRPQSRWAPASEAAPRPAPAPPPPAPDPKPGFWVLAGGGARLARGILVKKPAQHRRPAGRVVARTDRGGVRSWTSLTPPRSVPATTRPAAGPGSPERSRTLVLRGRLRARDLGRSACGF